jgi:PKD repeat protein
VLFIAFVTVISCKRIPVPEFDYTPFDNPETGDTIQFLNVSVNADSYDWDYGDGSTSIEINPSHIYSEAGIFEVKLTAYNDHGDDAIVKTLTIFEATELGFLTYVETDSTILSGTEVWIYDNTIDWEERNEPLRIGTTDQEGIVYFLNVEPSIYHIYATKQDTGGYWFFSGNTDNAIVQNEINLFSVPCTWIDSSKKAAPLKLMLEHRPGEPHR